MVDQKSIEEKRIEKRIIVGKVIKKLRRSQDIDVTQKDISIGLGFSQPVFQQRIETGKRHLDVVELWEICQFLNISFTEAAAQIEKALLSQSL